MYLHNFAATAHSLLPPQLCTFSRTSHLTEKVHEAIIPRELWERVQEKRGSLRHYTRGNGERSLFSGLLVCADCGCNLHFHFSQKNPELDNLFEKLYEDNVAGKISDERFVRMSRKYEDEQAEKVDGAWRQRLTIHYNCIGAVTLPDTAALPAPEVTMNTRRGVYVTYEPYAPSPAEDTASA